MHAILQEYRIGHVLQAQVHQQIPVALEVLRQQSQRPRAMGNGVLRRAAHLRERFCMINRLEDGVPTEARAAPRGGAAEGDPRGDPRAHEPGDGRGPRRRRPEPRAQARGVLVPPREGLGRGAVAAARGGPRGRRLPPRGLRGRPRGPVRARALHLRPRQRARGRLGRGDRRGRPRAHVFHAGHRRRPLHERARRPGPHARPHLGHQGRAPRPHRRRRGLPRLPPEAALGALDKKSSPRRVRRGPRATQQRPELRAPPLIDLGEEPKRRSLERLLKLLHGLPLNPL